MAAQHDAKADAILPTREFSAAAEKDTTLLEQVKASTTSHEIWTSVRAGSASIFKTLIKVEKYRNTGGVERLRLVTRHRTGQHNIALPQEV